MIQEDLFRGKTKPYVDFTYNQDIDDEANYKYWFNHQLRRTNSIIADSMMGIFKSGTRCGTCRKENKLKINFNVFTVCQLPIINYNKSEIKKPIKTKVKKEV